MIEEGNLREEMLNSIQVVKVKVKEMEERREDIKQMVEFLMKKIEEKEGIKKRKIGKDEMEVLKENRWKGNIRKLRKNVERMMIMKRGEEKDEIVKEDILKEEIGEKMKREKKEQEKKIMEMKMSEERESLEKE